MEIKSKQINTMFVERDPDGNITGLYGSHFDQEQQTLTVFRGTRNMKYLAPQIYGEKYTNEEIIKKLADRPYHNFIGILAGTISMPIDMNYVYFED